jgi:hypothetical protein
MTACFGDIEDNGGLWEAVDVSADVEFPQLILRREAPTRGRHDGANWFTVLLERAIDQTKIAGLKLRLRLHSGLTEGWLTTSWARAKEYPLSQK